MKQMPSYTFGQTLWLVLLRVMIGWHFLYEGLVKALTHEWSAYHYLMDSKGIFADLFYKLATNPILLSITEYFNIIGLITIGICLIGGLFSKFVSIGGLFFLIMYYFSHPPFAGADYLMPTEGSYLWIDKNIIEAVALMVLIYFPTSHLVGIDRFIYRAKKGAENKSDSIFDF